MEQVNGKYEGFGIQIMTSYDGEKYTSIVDKVFDGSPAKEAGLLVGDILLELDGVTLSDKEPDYLPNIVKYGEKGTHTLKISRNNDELEVTLTRKLVYIESVTGEVVDGVGYIKIDTFSNTTVDQVKKYINEFGDKVTSLVLDVRDNSGGTLESVYQLSDLFIEKGKNIYQYKDKNGNVEIHKAVEGIYREFDKIAVLINESSASASEVLTLALKESANAKVVGTKSFGKGTVQETRSLSNGKTTKITIAYWLGPNGTSINEVGIEPDVIVEDVDKQLSEAIKLVK
jgi:carboxyl-terminal processing protease